MNRTRPPPIAFVEHHSSHDTDILQEYFVPLDSFVVLPPAQLPDGGGVAGYRLSRRQKCR
jgi:hypothetical protein